MAAENKSGRVSQVVQQTLGLGVHLLLHAFATAGRLGFVCELVKVAGLVKAQAQARAMAANAEADAPASRPCSMRV